MSWHQSRLFLVVLFCVAAFCVVLVGLLLVLVCLWRLRDGLLDCVQVLYQFTLEAPQSADGHVYALINKLTLFCNMQLNVLNDLAEAMKALDGKKAASKASSRYAINNTALKTSNRCLTKLCSKERLSLVNSLTPWQTSIC